MAPPARPACSAIQPACPAHHLDDQRPVVAFRRGVQPVDGFHGDVHGRVEAEGVVGGAEVVVDCLRHPDDRDPLFAQAGGHAERVLAADRDQRVDTQAGQVVLDPLDAVATAAARVLQRVRPGRSEDRAAARQDAAHRLHVQGHRVAFERPSPPVAEPDEFQAVLLHALADDGADNCIEAGAVAATGENSHSHATHHSGREPRADGCGTSRGKLKAARAAVEVSGGVTSPGNITQIAIILVVTAAAIPAGPRRRLDRGTSDEGRGKGAQ